MQNFPTCPRCSSDKGLTIAYGLESPDRIEESVYSRPGVAGRLHDLARDSRLAVRGERPRVT
jgi:hypothetical protein